MVGVISSMLAVKNSARNPPPVKHTALLISGRIIRNGFFWYQMRGAGPAIPEGYAARTMVKVNAIDILRTCEQGKYQNVKDRRCHRSSTACHPANL